MEAVAVIRQLEFALTQLQLSVEELVDALEYVQLGKTTLKPNWSNYVTRNVEKCYIRL